MKKKTIEKKKKKNDKVSPPRAVFAHFIELVIDRSTAESSVIQFQSCWLPVIASPLYQGIRARGKI